VGDRHPRYRVRLRRSKLRRTSLPDILSSGCRSHSRVALDQRYRVINLGATHTEVGLTGRTAFSRWTPLWGMAGIGLPLTFAGEVRPVTMFVRPHELIPLYATEWIIVTIIGIGLCGVAMALDAAYIRLRTGMEKNVASRAAFAMIVAASVVLGAQIWLSSFGYDALSLNGWHTLLLATAFIAGVGAGWHRCRETLSRLASLARPIALLGSITLLPTTFVRGLPHTAPVLPANSTSQPVEHPNIVLISLDALAADHLIPYGTTRTTSPYIAAFASQSIVFERFHANGNFTTPGVASMLTGVLPWTHRAFQLAGRPSVGSIAESLPARLHAAGYLTAYFSSNPWAGARRQGFSAYFDHHDSSPEWETAPCFDAVSDRLPYLCAASSNPLIGLPFKSAVRTADAIGLLNPSRYADPGQIVTAAESWLKQNKSAPIFMWVHFLPPHDPYAAPKPWLGRFDSSAVAATAATSHPRFLFDAALDPPSRISALEARYDESISYVDRYVGQLLMTVRATLGPNTAIMLTADHGESFSHDYGGHGGVMLYEDLLRIPLILRLPGESTASERRVDLTDQTDIAPTIAAIAHVTPSPTWSGVSLLARPSRSTIFAMSFEQNKSQDRLSTGSVAVLSDNWKLVRFIGTPRYPKMPRLETQLFDLANDPREHHNLAATHPDLVADLSTQIDEQLERYGGPVGE
jgi:arylsulfatase A-like enzyme